MLKLSFEIGSAGAAPRRSGSAVPSSVRRFFAAAAQGLRGQSAAAPQDSLVGTYSPLYEPKSIAPYMDVERVHAILAAAEAGNTRELFALYRDMTLSDSHTQNEISKRKLAVLGDKMVLSPSDKTKPDDVDAAAAVKLAIARCPSWLTACIHLLDGALYPVALVEKVFAPAPGGGYTLAKLVPVPYQLLDYVSGSMRIRAVDAQGRPTLDLYEPDPARYIIHRGHLLTTYDNWGGPLRSIIWWWLFSIMDRSWWTRFLERFGSPFIVGKIDGSDDGQRILLESAISYAVKIGGLVVDKATEIDLKEAATSNADAYDKFLGVCQREKSKLILGQSLSSTPDPTGLGSGTADLQDAVRQDIRIWDSTRLGDTMRSQLFSQFLQINSISGDPPTLSWGGESPAELKGLADLLTSLKGAGLQVQESAIPVLSERVGVPLERAATPGPALPAVFSEEACGGHPFAEGGEAPSYLEEADRSVPSAFALPFVDWLDAAIALASDSSVSGADLFDRMTKQVDRIPALIHKMDTSALADVMHDGMVRSSLDGVEASIAHLPESRSVSFSGENPWIAYGPLDEAVKKLDLRTPVGSKLSSAEWLKVQVALRERAMFSAKVESVRFLSEAQTRLHSALSLEKEKLANGQEAFADRSSFIAEMRQVAKDEGIETTDPAHRGTIRDIRSAKRLGLIWDMQTAQATEYSRWKMDQDPDILDAYPAQRFVRIESRIHPRGEAFWRARWAEAGSKVNWVGARRGDMVALKTSPIWAALSTFGTPWPPFDFGSGMGLEDVDRDEAESLGLVKPGSPVPQEGGGIDDFNAGLEQSIIDVAPSLVNWLMDQFGSQIRHVAGKLEWVGQ